LGNTLAQFAGCELGERDCRDRPGIDTGGQKHDDTPGQQRRLARTGGGLDDLRRIDFRQRSEAFATVSDRGHGALQNREIAAPTLP
jgi:hypothetical protein